MPTHLYDTFHETYHDVLTDLAELGISGKYLYLAEVFPLIEMIWADGVNQENEIIIFNSALRQHVQRINAYAGFTVFRFDEAQEFISPFLEKQPSKEVFALLRKLYVHTLEQIHDVDRKKDIINSFLSFSLDIAASCVSEYPYKNDERFEMPEKMCFFSILSDIGLGGIKLS